MPSTEENDFQVESFLKSQKKNLLWYDANVVRVLKEAKEKDARDMDKLIKMGENLHCMLCEKRPQPVEVPPKKLEFEETSDLMRPVDPKLTEILMESSEKGGTDRYLHERYKTPPEGRFYFRACTSWDYGWSQKGCTLKAGDPYFGRNQIIKNSFYRSNNVGPDANHYRIPLAAEPGTCQETLE